MYYVHVISIDCGEESGNAGTAAKFTLLEALVGHDCGQIVAVMCGSVQRFSNDWSKVFNHQFRS